MLCRAHAHQPKLCSMHLQSIIAWKSIVEFVLCIHGVIDMTTKRSLLTQAAHVKRNAQQIGDQHRPEIFVTYLSQICKGLHNSPQIGHPHVCRYRSTLTPSPWHQSSSWNSLHQSSGKSHCPAFRLSYRASASIFRQIFYEELTRWHQSRCIGPTVFSTWSAS